MSFAFFSAVVSEVVFEVIREVGRCGEIGRALSCSRVGRGVAGTSERGDDVIYTHVLNKGRRGVLSPLGSEYSGIARGLLDLRRTAQSAPLYPFRLV